MWEKLGIRPVPLQRLHVGRSAAAGGAGAAGADGGGEASKSASSQSVSVSVVVVVIGFGWRCGDRTRTGVGLLAFSQSYRSAGVLSGQVTVASGHPTDLVNEREATL
jgi:hypothetical protein